MAKRVASEAHASVPRSIRSIDGAPPPGLTTDENTNAAPERELVGFFGQQTAQALVGREVSDDRAESDDSQPRASTPPSVRRDTDSSLADCAAKVVTSRSDKQ